MERLMILYPSERPKSSYPTLMLPKPPAENSSPKHRRTVHEIFLSNDNASENSCPKVSDEMTDTDLKRFRGIRRREYGKWTAEIRDPFKNRKVHLGTFDSPEEASRVFEATKAEFREMKAAQSVVGRAGARTNSSRQSCPKKDDAGEKPRKKCSGETTCRTELKVYQKIRQLKCGSWSAEIHDPFMKRNVFLGLFDTEEEASRAFEGNKVEFRYRLKAQSTMDCAPPGTDSSGQIGEQIEPEMNLGSILIDNNGFLLGEYSNLDDDLTISD